MSKRPREHRLSARCWALVLWVCPGNPSESPQVFVPGHACHPVRCDGSLPPPLLDG